MSVQGMQRRLWMTLFSEVQALQEGLLEQQRYGVRIDWSGPAVAGGAR